MTQTTSNNTLHSNPHINVQYIITSNLFFPSQKLCLIALVSKAFLSDEESDDDEKCAKKRENRGYCRQNLVGHITVFHIFPLELFPITAYTDAMDD